MFKWRILGGILPTDALTTTPPSPGCGDSDSQGRGDGGGYRYLYPPKKKISPNKFLWGKMTPEWLFYSFIHPQKLLYP